MWLKTFCFLCSYWPSKSPSQRDNGSRKYIPGTSPAQRGCKSQGSRWRCILPSREAVILIYLNSIPWGTRYSLSVPLHLLPCAVLNVKGVWGKTKILPVKDLLCQLSPPRCYHLPKALPPPSPSRDSNGS